MPTKDKEKKRATDRKARLKYRNKNLDKERAKLRIWGARNCPAGSTRLTYRGMRTRCYCPSASGYEYYGGRGITICERWLVSFDNFLEDMGERPEGMSIDRIDPDGHYEPSNCRWATAEQQQWNTRKRRKRPINVTYVPQMQEDHIQTA